MKKQTRLSVYPVWCLLFCSISIAQEIGLPFTRYYSPKEYDNTSQVWCAIQDDNGVMYFGMTNGGGIAEYDGRSWRIVDIPNKTTVFSFAKDTNGLIYTGAINDFGFLRNNLRGKKEFVSLRHLLPDTTMKFRAVWQTIIDDNDVYFLSVEAIFKFTNTPTPSITAFLPGEGSSFMGIFSHSGNVYCYQKGRGLVRVGRDSIELISEFFRDKAFRNGLPIAQDSILIPTRTYGMFIYRPVSGTFVPFVPRTVTMSGVNIYSSTVLRDRSIVLSTLTQGALLLSAGGEVLQRWDESRGLAANAIYGIYNSPGGNLWLATENGIARTDASTAWSRWDKRNGLHGTVADILRYRGTLYMATFGGIYFLNEHNAIEKVNGIPQGQCWSLLEFTTEENDRKILAGTPGGIYEIKGAVASVIRPGRYGLTMLRSRFDRSRLFIVDDPRLVSLKYVNGKWREEGIISGVRDNIRRIVEDDYGDLWLGTYNAGIIRVKMNLNNIIQPASVRYYTVNDGLPSLTAVMPNNIKGKLLFTTEKGFYSYNDKTDRFEPYDTMNAIVSGGKLETGIIRELNDGSIAVLPWSNREHDPGILELEQNGEYSWNFKPFRRLDRMGFNALHEDPDGVLWIGTTEGLFRYDGNADTRNYESGFHALIRKVSIKNDSIVSLGGSIAHTVVSYDENDVSFDIAAPFFDDESKTLFSYQLKGYDKEWSTWSTNALAVYTNLDEGEYTFRAKAKNLYNHESSVAEFSLKVLPPWFRTWWAYLTYIVFLVISIGTFDTWNKKRLKRLHDRHYEEEKQRQQHFSRMVIERQEEERKRISREMHDGIGQELLILKHNLQLKLREKGLDSGLKQMLDEQSAAASNIISEVRNISHDLRPPELDRLGLTETIKSILKRIRNTKKIEVIGEIDTIDGFFPKDAEINIVRIIQEVMSNILKHAEATAVTIRLTQSGGAVTLTISDNGKGMKGGTGDGRGLGMNDISERVQLLGGTMNIATSKKSGTTFIFHFQEKAPNA